MKKILTYIIGAIVLIFIILKLAKRKVESNIPEGAGEGGVVGNDRDYEFSLKDIAGKIAKSGGNMLPENVGRIIWGVPHVEGYYTIGGNASTGESYYKKKDELLDFL